MAKMCSLIILLVDILSFAEDQLLS